jgi:hypothetical protein
VCAAAARQPLPSCNPRIATWSSGGVLCQSSVFPLVGPSASDGQDRAGNWYLYRLPSSRQITPPSACPVTRPACARRRPGPNPPRHARTIPVSSRTPPGQLLDTPALALGRTARAAVPDSHRDSLLARRRRRAVVDVARGGNRCADTLGDNLLDDHDAVTSFAAQPHLITGPYGMRGLDADPVDPDVPSPAGNGRGRAGPGQPHRPDPAVHTSSLITCHAANCNAIWRSPTAPGLTSSAKGRRSEAGAGDPNAVQIAAPGPAGESNRQAKRARG